MSKILLIVGNGLSIDLFKHLNLSINPSSPFSFDIPDPFDEKKGLLDTLSRVKGMIEDNPNKRDFDIIQNFIENYSDDISYQWQHCELRHYLSLAYSYANVDLLTRWKKDWKWAKWINKNYNKLVGIVSLNYDLGLETTLNKSSLEYYRIGSTEENNPKGIPIFKPHGSCDFDISDKAISMPLQTRLKNLTFLNNCIVNGRGRIEIVSKKKLLEPRTEADIVLPFEFSPQTKLTWVKQGYETITKISKTANTCIIIGISYQPCDRKEIDSIIDNLPSNINIQLVNPNPNQKLMEKLKKITNNVQEFTPRYFFDNIA